MEGINIVTENQIDRISSEFFTKLQTKTRVDELDADIMRTDWCDEIISRIHYIDNIFTNPKRFLEIEELILDIEKAKKADVDSVKHLSKHSDFISDFDEEKNMVIPKKLMNSIKEDTYDLYENRFAYTLVLLIEDLIYRFETYEDDKETNIKERFFYGGDTQVDNEKIECQISMTASTKFNNKTGLPPRIKEKIDVVKNALIGWQHSVLYKDLKKRRVAQVQNPIKRTNTILKNPNFQQAAELWDFLYSYSVGTRNNESGESTDLINEETTKLVNNSLLIYYLIMKRMNTKGQIDNQNYREEIKAASLEMMNNSMAMLMQMDANYSKEDMMSEAGKSYEKIIKEKGADASEISNKIKETIKDYLDKVNYSFFAFGKDGIELQKAEAPVEEKDLTEASVNADTLNNIGTADTKSAISEEEQTNEEQAPDVQPEQDKNEKTAVDDDDDDDSFDLPKQKEEKNE